MSKIFQDISVYSPLLPICFFLLFFVRNNRKDIWVVFIYSLFAFTTDRLLLNFKSSEYPRLSFSILSLFTIIEFTLFTIFINFSLRSRKIKSSILIVSSFFVFFSIVFYFLKLGNEKFDSVSASIEAILILAFCILFLFDNINTEPSFIYEKYEFWIIVGMLIYLGGVLFLFIFSSSFTKDEKNIYWNINYSLNILKNILFAIAFFMKKEATNNLTMQNRYNI
jgi:hypothetical protein